MSFWLKGRVIFFATNNIHKFNEARKALAEHKISVGMLRIKGSEIQSDSIEDIARTAAIDAFKKCNLPIIVEDAGLFIQALKGFPGPYAAYACDSPPLPRIRNPQVLQRRSHRRNHKRRTERKGEIRLRFRPYLQTSKRGQNLRRDEHQRKEQILPPFESTPQIRGMVQKRLTKAYTAFNQKAAKSIVKPH